MMEGTTREQAAPAPPLDRMPFDWAKKNHLEGYIQQLKLWVELLSTEQGSDSASSADWDGKVLAISRLQEAGDFTPASVIMPDEMKDAENRLAVVESFLAALNTENLGMTPLLESAKQTGEDSGGKSSSKSAKRAAILGVCDENSFQDKNGTVWERRFFLKETYFVYRPDKHSHDAGLPSVHFVSVDPSSAQYAKVWGGIDISAPGLPTELLDVGHASTVATIQAPVDQAVTELYFVRYTKLYNEVRKALLADSVFMASVRRRREARSS